jgi:hypothetical protein
MVGTLLALAVIVSFGGLGSFLPTAQAASLTALSDTLSSSKVSTASSHVIKFTTPSGSTTSQTIVITFPSDFNFTGKSATSSVTFTHGASTGLENSETLASAATASSWGSAFSGTQNRILTLTTPTDGVGAAQLAANDKVIITYDSTNSINASTPNTYAITINGGFGDTGTITVPILSNDQVAVSATVTQSLTFSLSTTTVGFGNLSITTSTFATAPPAGTSTETEAFNAQASTNASSGYTITVKGATLTDSLSHTIAAIGGTATTSNPGTNQFGIRVVTSGSGTGTSTSPYNASGFAYAANATTTSQIASAAAATLSNTYSVRMLANVGATTPAGDYSTALTMAATANF